jgi:RNA repair, ligase-Pnkp-associating, region of Hen1
MLLTITYTGNPATDLSYLLHKSPFRVHSFEQVFGKAYVFYPETSAERCTAALLLEIDPIGLVRNRRGPSGEAHVLEEYVNDRPYAASSFLSVAIARTFGTAITGRSKERQELAETQLPLEARIAVVPCRGGEDLLRRLFEPLAYEVTALRHPLDTKFPEWGESPYFTVNLKATVRLNDLLTHLYVLIPVLDDDRHYWVGDAEVEKLLRHGEGWLREHPERELITNRYLKHQKRLAREALTRLIGEEEPETEELAEIHTREEEAIEKPISLAEQRLGAAMSALWRACWLEIRTQTRVGKLTIILVANSEHFYEYPTIRQSKRERCLPEATNEYLEAQYLPKHNRRFAREAARAENYHVRAPSTAKLREIFRLETERSISNDWVVPYRGHFLQLQPQNRRYGPTKAKALVCEWEDGAVEVHYRGECMDYTDLVVRPQVVQAGPSKPRRETAKSVGSKPAQGHPWRQGYEQRMKLQKLSGSQVSALVGESASATP